MKTLLKIAIMVMVALVVAKPVKSLKLANFINHGLIKTMNIGITEIALDKDECRAAAADIVENNKIEGMSEESVAKEIYAHIFLHDVISGMPSIVRNNPLVSRLYNSTCNGIDLEDFGDTFVRQIAYSVIWFLA